MTGLALIQLLFGATVLTATATVAIVAAMGHLDPTPPHRPGLGGARPRPVNGQHGNTGTDRRPVRVPVPAPRSSTDRVPVRPAAPRPVGAGATSPSGQRRRPSALARHATCLGDRR